MSNEAPESQTRDDAPKPPKGDTITIRDFAKLDIRVGRILEAADHPNADRLVVLKVDTGDEKARQLVAGIKQHYTPDELVGRSIAVICNLQPAVLRGVESQGMLLAASGTDTVSFLTPVREVPPGSKVS